MGTEEPYRFLGVAALGPAVHLAERPTVYGGGVQPALRRRVSAVSAVVASMRALRPDRGEEGDGAGGGRVRCPRSPAVGDQWRRAGVSQRWPGS